MLIEIRWHGRGGQGAVTVARILAHASLIEGKFAQAFPEFGAERAGAPVKSFTRISDKPILLHSQVYMPDIVVVIDPTLLAAENITQGLKEDGKLLINSEKSPVEFRTLLDLSKSKIYTVDAKRIALTILGRPIYNTPMLGALLKVSQAASIETIGKVVSQRFPGSIGQKNMAAIKSAYEQVKET